MECCFTSVVFATTIAKRMPPARDSCCPGFRNDIDDDDDDDDDDDIDDDGPTTKSPM
jgi:hypothetical protein